MIIRSIHWSRFLSTSLSIWELPLLPPFYWFCDHDKAFTKERSWWKPLRHPFLLFIKNNDKKAVIQEFPVAVLSSLLGKCICSASWICPFLIFSELAKDILSSINNTNSYRSLFVVSTSFIHNKRENSIITFIKTELYNLEPILKWLAFQVTNKALVTLSSWWVTRSGGRGVTRTTLKTIRNYPP